MTAVAAGVSFEPCPPEWPSGELAGVMRYEATDGWCVLTPCRVRPPVEDPEYLAAVVRQCEQLRPDRQLDQLAHGPYEDEGDDEDADAG